MHNHIAFGAHKTFERGTFPILSSIPSIRILCQGGYRDDQYQDKKQNEPFHKPQ
jgi:hypothetical protein